MTSARSGRVGMGPSTEDDYGLDAIAQHNAIPTTETYPSYQNQVKGLGIYDGYMPTYNASQSYIQNTTPRSARSGRSTARHDSPFSTGKSRVSKSPAARAKKEKKAKSDKARTPRLTAPLSVLTKDMTTPLKDMDAWVNRSAEVRRQETEKRNGYVTRPMNSFMLYRSAYAERTKQWCTQNNHQVVSSVSGESWPMEPQDVRDQFNEWAKLERANHQAAHPDYKFSPSKPANKRRKEEFSDDEGEASDLGADPDGDYNGGRAARQKRQASRADSVFLNNTVGFSSNPYYGQRSTGYEQSQYQYSNPGRPLPSNIAYDSAGMPYNPQTGHYLHGPAQQAPQYPYAEPAPTPRPSNATPSTVGGYGLPGGQRVPVDELFGGRCDTPMQMYEQYASSSYQQQVEQQRQQAQQLEQHRQQLEQFQQRQSQAYEHQQYLQNAARPVSSVDPTLAGNEMKYNPGESQFESAMGDMTSGGYGSMNFFDEATSPNGTVYPPWTPTTR